MQNGDITNIEFNDWSDADIVFANSTCYDDALMEKLSNIAGNIDIILYYN